MKNKSCLRAADGGELVSRWAKSQPLRMTTGGTWAEEELSGRNDPAPAAAPDPRIAQLVEAVGLRDGGEAPKPPPVPPTPIPDWFRFGLREGGEVHMRDGGWQRQMIAGADKIGKGGAAGIEAVARPIMHPLGRLIGESTARTALSAPGALAAVAGDSALKSYGTPTEEYYRQAGIEPGNREGLTGLAKDVGMRGVGVLSDYGKALIPGLRSGGEMPYTGTGGRVPGDGPNKDTVDAKYAPGEFVVSNAMLKRAPGLRDQLRELREETLEGQGKTVEQADEEALEYDGGDEDNSAPARRSGSGLRGDIHRAASSGDRSVTLRAVNAFEVAPYVDHRPYTGYPAMPPQAQLGYTPATPGTAVATTPYRPNFTTPNYVAPEAPAAPAQATRPTTWSKEASDFRAQRDPVGPARPAAPTEAPKPATYKAGKAVGEAGLGTRRGVGAGMGAGVAIDTAAESAARPTEDYRRRLGLRADPSFEDTTWGRLKQFGDDASVRAAGVGTDFVANVLDAPVSLLNTMHRLQGGKGEISLPGGSFGQILRKNDSPAAAQEFADVSGAQPAPAASAAKPGYTHSPGDATMPGQDPGRFALRAEPAAAAPIDYAARKAERDAQTQRDIAQGDRMQSDRQAQEAAGYASQDRQTVVNNLQAAKVDMERGKIDPSLYMALRKEAALAEHGRDTNAASRANNAATNSTLRDNNAATTGAAVYGADATAGTAAGKLRYDMGKDARDARLAQETHDQSMGDKAEAGARGAFKGLFDTVVDGKPVARPDLEALAHSEVARATEGKWSSLSPKARAAAQANAVDHVKLLGSARTRQNNSFLQSIGVNKPDAPHGGMPTQAEMQGATLTEVGRGEGMTTKNLDYGDYKLTLKDGKVMHFARGDLTEAQLSRLEQLGAKIGK